MDNALRLIKDVHTCEEDLRRVTNILTISSAIVASIVSIVMLGRRKMIQFPDNILLLGTVASALISWTRVLGLMNTEDITSARCTLEGLLFQLSGMGLVWTWILLVIVMFQDSAKQTDHRLPSGERGRRGSARSGSPAAGTYPAGAAGIGDVVC